jgi:sugar lactone lactonase YvrE
MRHHLLFAAFAAVSSTVLGAAALGQNQPAALETVATTPVNGLEGLDVARDGSIYVTDAVAHAIYKITPDGKLSEFSKVGSAVQVILLTPDGAVVTAQERDPDFSAMRPPAAGGMNAATMGALGAEIIVLDKSGHVVRKLPGAAGSFFNGIDRFGKDFLIADSTAGAIWRFDEHSSSIKVWLKADALLGPGGRFPAANGIKVVKGDVYVSNTAAGTVYRIATSNGEPKGRLTPVAQHVQPDDFAVARDGTIYLPSGTKVLKISPSGQIDTLVDGCMGCDAALLTDHEHSLLLVTHGFGPNAGSGHVYRLKLKS